MGSEVLVDLKSKIEDRIYRGNRASHLTYDSAEKLPRKGACTENQSMESPLSRPDPDARKPGPESDASGIAMEDGAITLLLIRRTDPLCLLF